MNLGSVAAGLLDPEVDDGSALDDRVVADDEDDLRLPDGAQRKPERLECVRGRLGKHRRVRVESAAQQAAERVSELGRLGAREGGDDRAARLEQHRLELLEGVVPRDLR